MTAVPSSGNGRLIRLTVCQKIRLRRPLRIRPFSPISNGGHDGGKGLLFLKSWCDFFSYSSALDIMHAHGALKQFVSYSFSCLKLLQCRFLGGGERDCRFRPFYSHRVSVRTLPYQPCSISLLLLLRRGANDNRVTFYLAVPA